MTSIAVELTNSDHGPLEIFKGGCASARHHPHVDYLMVGDDKAVKLCQNQTDTPINVRLLDTTNLKGDLAVILDGKQDPTPLYVASKLAHKQIVNAVLSFGSTKEQVKTSVCVLKRVFPKVLPAIAALLPNYKGGTTVLMDAGASFDRTPYSLAQSAIMGAIFAQHILRIGLPVICLLNVGTEKDRGTKLVRETDLLLNSSSFPYPYIGYKEGHSFADGKADVVVCNGEIGNICLKTAEGTASGLIDEIRHGFKRNLYTKLIGSLAAPIIKSTLKKYDCEEFGSMPLLGFNRNVIAAHGRSKGRSVETAHNFAVKFARQGNAFQDDLVSALSKYEQVTHDIRTLVAV